MDSLLYAVARALVALVQALPLSVVARLGYAGGAVAYWLDGRHRRVALKNLAAAFGNEMTPVALRALARENFRRIGENFTCAVKTASLRNAEIPSILEVVGVEKGFAAQAAPSLPSRVFAIGHFGNFELFARAALFTPGYQFATTYRALRQPSLNRLLQSLREQSGCLFFERRTDGAALKSAMAKGGMVVGFLTDQHAGQKGLWIPFLGRPCSTTAAPAVFALRYHCPLFPAICYRITPGRWRIEVGDEIPTHDGHQARPVEAITRDINQAFEIAVRRDPANWFWVHNRWKPRGRESNGQRAGAASPLPSAPVTSAATSAVPDEPGP